MNNRENFKEWMKKHPKSRGTGTYGDSPTSVPNCLSFFGNATQKLDIALPNGLNSIFDIDDYDIFTDIAKKIYEHPRYSEIDGKGKGQRWIRNGIALYAEFLAEKSENESLENVVFTSASEGKKVHYYTTRYERNESNKKIAKQIHGKNGLICSCCKFDFRSMYGELGENYIEVHHINPLYKVDEEIIINPETDLALVCSNCHRMIHRKRNKVYSIEEMKQIIEDNAHRK